jgi:hypothetical protein
MPTPIEGIQEIRKAASYAGGWATQLEQLLGHLVSDASSASPIVQALAGRVLPPGTEQAIARLITSAADEYERVARSAETYRSMAGGPLSQVDPTRAGLPQPGSDTGSPGEPSTTAQDPLGANQV